MVRERVQVPRGAGGSGDLDRADCGRRGRGGGAAWERVAAPRGAGGPGGGVGVSPGAPRG